MSIVASDELIRNTSRRDRLSALLDLAEFEEIYHFSEAVDHLAEAERHLNKYYRARKRRRRLQRLVPSANRVALAGGVPCQS